MPLVPGEPAPTPTPAGGITLEFELPANPNVKPMIPISQFMVLRNGTPEPRELAVIVEAENAAVRLWRKVAGTIPIDVEPGESERFVLPAFAFEPHASHKGAWHFRGTVWDESGKVIVVSEHRSLYTVVQGGST